VTTVRQGAPELPVQSVTTVSIYADLYRYRELFANLFRRDLQTRYKGSALGVLWSLINPLVLMGIYVLIFSLLWKVAQVPHYALYLLVGLVVWLFFSTSLTSASHSLVASAPLVKRVRFPRQLVPLSVVATQLVTYGAMLAVLIVANVIVLPDTRDTFLLSIPVSMLVVALVAGVSLLVACANVVFRDVEHLIGAALLPWFFLTPILYRLEDLPGGFKRYDWVVTILRWVNPLTPPIYALRDPLYYGRVPHWTDVLYLVVAAAVALSAGAWLFRRVDDRIAVEL
jgi:lipopolysaccharide transport system permease protein